MPERRKGVGVGVPGASSNTRSRCSAARPHLPPTSAPAPGQTPRHPRCHAPVQRILGQVVHGLETFALSSPPRPAPINQSSSTLVLQIRLGRACLRVNPSSWATFAATEFALRAYTSSLRRRSPRRDEREKRAAVGAMVAVATNARLSVTGCHRIIAFPPVREGQMLTMVFQRPGHVRSVRWLQERCADGGRRRTGPWRRWTPP